MPYASLNEVYGGGFGKADPNQLAQNYGLRNVEDFNQKKVPDSAMPMEVGVSNMDVIKFNQKQQREVGDGEPSFKYTTGRGVPDSIMDSVNHPDSDDEEEMFETFVPRGWMPRKKRSLHERFLEHFKKCSTCRQKVWEKFSNYVEKRKEEGQDIREMFGSGDVMSAAEKPSVPVVKDGLEADGSSNGDSYVDVIVMILLGVFIIFVLDAFVKLGGSIGGSTSTE